MAEVFAAANSHDPEDRSTAADELGRINHPAAHALLLHLGNDPDAGVRMMVAIALMIADPTPEGASELLDRLKEDPDPDVREQAVSSIECLS
jgi:HEAT repeat protein